MTTATPIRIELVSVPATDNTLGSQERSRLLKSTRKLEAVLGTTPLVIEALPARRKREGGIFHSPSSSISSVEDLMTAQKSSEHDYVFIRSNGRSAPYQHQYLPPPQHYQHSDSRAPSAASFYDASPSASSSRSASPMHTPSKKQRRAPPAPLDVQLALDISSGKMKKFKGPQPLSQPLLLRLRSVPTEAKSTSRGTKPYPAMPLSPANSTFTVDTSITSITLTSPPASPRSPRSRAKSSAALTDREKRKKMAKLARTLGENVPPELVFGQKAGKRRSSVSGSFVSTAPRVGQTFTIGEVSAPKASPAPAPAATATASSTTSSPASIPLTIAISREIETSKCASFLNMDSPATSSFPTKELGISGKGKRKHRPRSLTLGSSSAFAAFPKNVASSSTSVSKCTTQKQPASHTRGTTSLDVQRPSRTSSSEDRPLPPLPLRVRVKERVDEPAFARVEITPMRVMTGGEGERSERENEDWRRKEREWSGEWNLRDMEGVTRALRELRGR
ncbi:hypothetical protein BJ165DRAFT_1486912 [Panaeolus papilionaceus]|nr:hypothetical protein BJ165DRAFT_1486912 [Panaeolus papilionaceus]